MYTCLSNRSRRERIAPIVDLRFGGVDLDALVASVAVRPPSE